MGITDFFSDIYASMGFQEVHADAPKDDDDDSKEGGDDDKGEGEDKEEGGEDKEEGGDEEGGEEGGEEEEEEEEEEPVDPKTQLEEGECIVLGSSCTFVLVLTLLPFSDCARSSQCSGYKHHYEDCVKQVTAQHEDPNHKGPKEDCVEECKTYGLSYNSLLKHMLTFLAH